VASRRIDFDYQGQDVVAKLRYLDNGLSLQVGDAPAAALDFMPQGGGSDAPIDLRYRGRRQVVRVSPRRRAACLWRRRRTQIAELDPLASAGEGAGEGGRLTAPMPGKVVASPSRPATRSARASRWR
jgi:3-methylcrotonyl-CoA carboxylase alpha subunit